MYSTLSIILYVYYMYSNSDLISLFKFWPILKFDDFSQLESLRVLFKSREKSRVCFLLKPFIYSNLNIFYWIPRVISMSFRKRTQPMYILAVLAHIKRKVTVICTDSKTEVLETSTGNFDLLCNLLLMFKVFFVFY